MNLEFPGTCGVGNRQQNLPTFDRPLVESFIHLPCQDNAVDRTGYLESTSMLLIILELCGKPALAKFKHSNLRGQFVAIAAFACAVAFDARTRDLLLRNLLVDSIELIRDFQDLLVEFKAL